MSIANAAPAPPAIDIGRLLDEGRWSVYQKVLVALTSLTIVFDGADIQVLSFAVPSLMVEWGLARPAFAPVLAASLVGMMVGGALAGMVGDRLGRKVALIGSVILFSVFTLAVTVADGLLALGVLRFFAGVGLGGAVPNATALASEYVPARSRPFAVTLTIVCVPMGGTLAGFVAARVLPEFGWRALFLIGGLLPLAVAAFLVWAMPESPRYLARRERRWPELTGILRRAGHAVPAGSTFVDPADRVVARATIAALFRNGFAGDTLALWGAFISCLLAVYLAFNWVPAMLTGAKLDVATASQGLAYFNFGGVGAALLGALVMTRIGSKPTIAAWAAVAVVAAIAMAAMPIGPATAQRTVAMLIVLGAAINGVQCALYALATNVYPTALRATGVGTAVSVGRVGAVLSTYAGAWALDAGGTALFFALVATTMVLALTSSVLIERHIARRVEGQAG